MRNYLTALASWEDAGKRGIDATKKLPGEGFRRARPPLIKMDAAEGERFRAIRERK